MLGSCSSTKTSVQLKVNLVTCHDWEYWQLPLEEEATVHQQISVSFYTLHNCTLFLIDTFKSNVKCLYLMHMKCTKCWLLLYHYHCYYNTINKTITSLVQTTVLSRKVKRELQALFWITHFYIKYIIINNGSPDFWRFTLY